jgi:predicted Zn-dependent peptidase
MKKFLLAILLIQGVLVSAVLKNVDIKGVSVPVIYEKSSSLPIVSLQLVIQKAGSIEDVNKAGLARFVANMLGDGSKKKGSVKFATELENRAISLHASAGVETFNFELSLLKEQFDFGLDMLKELMSDPNFSKESFEKNKQLTLGKISSKQSDFDYIASLNLKNILFENTPLGHAYNGDEKSINSLSLNDVEDFYNSHMDLANMIVVIGGDLSFDEVKASLQKLLSDVKIGKKRELKRYSVTNTNKEVVEIKPSEQAYIYFGAPLHVEPNSKDLYKSKVAAFILGESGFGSRLMEEIRVKRGLAYSVYSRNHVNSSNSYFSGYLQTKNESLEEAKKIVKQEIEKFVKDGVSKEELKQAKKFLLGSEPLRNETLSQRLSRAFFEYYRGFELGYSKKELEKIESLSLEDLNEFIKKHDEITKLNFSIVTNEKR